ncbi:hypothetical protein N7536_009404 [Penicillium majusculum]|uniref:F-box domain-containing protein n=1 Tax=Penicillium solitum TaxID=60172 RepID=A0A1V6RA46_9EURO|nr:uncharacterized protein PENSOL_c010G07262 [Penicillium solitum]KAJ5686785.1 hypothetical protein N7536_009404 [Penicillium majusculum]OQD98153.1 hypothetical protein PENSOL_c010G07262 [Penicillium solitum]
MPSLMDLPLEIRAIIFKVVINGHRIPPISPSKLNMVHLLDMKYRANLSRLRPYYEQRDAHSPSNSLPLLLTSRQVSTETQWILNRTNNNYVLDISVLNDLDLFATCVSVLQLTTRLSTLHNDSSGMDQWARRKNAQNEWGHICPYGNRKICVENLILDFHSAETVLPYPPDNLGYRAWADKHGGGGKPINEQEEEDESLAYKTRPEWLLYYLQDWLEFITDMSYNEAEYGGAIYKRIGTISMLVDGRLKTTIDLAGILARLTRPADTIWHLQSEIRLSEFWEWKKTTLLRREALRFPVVWPQDMERE